MNEVVKVLSQEYVIKHVDVIDKDTTVLGMIDHIENVIYISRIIYPLKKKKSRLFMKSFMLFLSS